MTKVIIATPVPDDRKELFTSAADADITFIDRTAFNMDEIIDAEVILGNLPLSVIKECRYLKWLQLDSAGRVVRASIVAPTSQNVANLENDIRQLAEKLVAEGVDEPAIRLCVEELIRAYDPCLSCSVH